MIQLIKIYPKFKGKYFNSVDDKGFLLTDSKKTALNFKYNEKTPINITKEALKSFEEKVEFFDLFVDYDVEKVITYNEKLEKLPYDEVDLLIFNIENKDEDE